MPRITFLLCLWLTSNSSTFDLGRNPNGELRANLVFPRGTATISYDTLAQPVRSTFPAPIGPQLAVSASIQVSVTGLTGTVAQAHLHGPAFFGQNADIFAPLCGPCNSLSAPGVFSQTFTNVSIPLALLEMGTAYINLHTAANPGGEARGQLMTFTNPTFADGANVGTALLDMLQEPVGTSFVFTANSAQNVGVNIRSQASASFTMTFTPATATITISPIIIAGLSSELQAMHIHGPCFSRDCNAPVVFTICGPPGTTPCPSSTGATVNSPPVVGPLFHSILRGDRVYYVNIHSRL
jgi:hypothetical protein